MNKVFIIAEAGVNHNGNINIAKKMIDAASLSGADAIKFQTFVAEECVSEKAEKAEYQKNNSDSDNVESQLDMIKRLELSFDSFVELKEYCDSADITFLSTPFDLMSIDFLEEIEMPFWKIPSGEITNYPYLEKIAKTNKPIIMSTGMATIDEIDIAINILSQNGAGDVTLLHCNTEYPTPIEDANLFAITTLKKRYGVNVGYSDHTLGYEAAIASVALGAVVIEKHFTLDKSFEGPDHSASMSVDELNQLVKAVRRTSLALGDGRKHPSNSEIKNINIVRKSIVASSDIKKGDLLDEKNITVKRPGTGINAILWYDVIGTRAVRDFKKDEQIVL